VRGLVFAPHPPFGHLLPQGRRNTTSNAFQALTLPLALRERVALAPGEGALS